MKQWIILTSMAFVSSLASAQIPGEYPREAERDKMLAKIEATTPQGLQIDFATHVGPRERAFIEVFRGEFWPMHSRLAELDQKESQLYVALDRALYRDEAEKKAWNEAMLAAGNKVNEIRTSPKWRDVMTRLNELAQGLNGDLPDYVRRRHEEMIRSEFGESELPLLTRLNEVMAQIKTIANSSPVAKNLGEYGREVEAIEKKFLAGEISFGDASARMDRLQPISRAAHGKYIAESSRELMNEAAIIRTRLARAKGFRSWAEYQVATKANVYAPGYRTPQERIRFLRDILASTKDAHARFLRQRASEIPGADFDGIRVNQGGLFGLPTSALISEYFPVEKVETVWKTTMLESGFSNTVVDRINLDSYPREGKQTHAYMMRAKGHEPRTVVIDARTMKVHVPREMPRFWNPALIYIVQNMRTDGPDAYETAFHEGGHGLDYSHRKEVLGFEQDSSYAETHSMTMEKFFEDAEFLLATGRKRDGTPIPREKVEEYLANSAANGLAAMRRQMNLALYDLELWSEPYEKGGEDFVSRALRIQRDLSRTYMFARKGQVVDGIDSRFSLFSTDHFYGGLVRYIGYVYASIAADMNYERILDVMEQTTARRTLLRQPGLGRLLAEGYYKHGFNDPFPVATERFTQRKFKAEERGHKADQAVSHWIEGRKAAQAVRCQALFH
jgi:hypothetical protein